MGSNLGSDKFLKRLGTDFKIVQECPNHLAAVGRHTKPGASAASVGPLGARGRERSESAYTILLRAAPGPKGRPRPQAARLQPLRLSHPLFVYGQPHDRPVYLDAGIIV